MILNIQKKLKMLHWNDTGKIDSHLPDNTIVIWLAEITTFYSRLNLLRSFLQDEEKQKADRFHFEIHQKRYTISQGLLRFLLAHYLNLAPREIQISTHKYGKPFIPNSLLYFNISHSYDYAIYAFSTASDLGIDIEFWRDRKFLDEIIDSNFSIKEQMIYHNLTDALKIASFYQGWTCNEAYIKAIGMGLSFPLQEFSVEMDPTKPAKLLETTPRKDCKTDWNLSKLPCPKNYSAALAFEKSGAELQFFKLTSKHLE